MRSIVENQVDGKRSVYVRKGRISAENALLPLSACYTGGMVSDLNIDAGRLSRRQFLAGALAAAVAVYGWRLRRRTQNPSPLALTLDIAGPDGSTAAVWWRDRLATHPDWRATIFVDSVALATTARLASTLWSNVAAQGHEIAYLTPPGAPDLDERRADLAAWRRQLITSLGAPSIVRFGRPADGTLQPSFVGLCAEAGLLVALWDEEWATSAPAILRLSGVATADFAHLAHILSHTGRRPDTLWEYCRRTATPIPYLAVHTNRLPAAMSCRQHDFAWLNVPIAGSHSTMTV